jgi:hypothetical protein
MAFASTKAIFTDFISTMLFKTAITSRISGEQRRLPPPAEGTETVGRHKARVRLLQYLLKKTDEWVDQLRPMADRISYRFALQQFGVAPDVLCATGRFCRDADDTNLFLGRVFLSSMASHWPRHLAQLAI